MATITEDYVSFETAKLLKEKGFTEACDKKYFGDDCSGPSYIREHWEDGGGVSPMSNSDLDDGSKYADISAPTLQMTMKWLREKHNIVVEPFIREGAEYVWFIHRIETMFNKKYLVFCWGSKNTKYERYEQACEAAINYCLKNLI